VESYAGFWWGNLKEKRPLATHIIRPKESYRVWCVTECDREASVTDRPRPTGGLLRHGGGGEDSFRNLDSMASHDRMLGQHITGQTVEGSGRGRINHPSICE
jgi:hypothetical protein